MRLLVVFSITGLGMLAAPKGFGAVLAGDVNLNGTVDDADAASLQRYLDGDLVLGCAERIAANVVRPAEEELDADDLDCLTDPNCVEAGTEVFLPPFVGEITATAPGSVDVRLMTFNIFFADGPPEDDPPVNDYLHRRDRIFAAIREHQPDVIGLQEAFYDDAAFPSVPEPPAATSERSTNDILFEFPEYELVVLILGHVSDRILYRSDRFDVTESGVVRVPDANGGDIKCHIPSIGVPPPGLPFDRYISWARLEDRISHDALFIYNVHLCPTEQAVREAHVIELLNRVAGHAEPVVALGDFNADEAHLDFRNSAFVFEPDTPTISLMKDPGNARRMSDSYRDFEPRNDSLGLARGTRNSWVQEQDLLDRARVGIHPFRKVDYIFVSDDLRTCAAAIDQRVEGSPGQFGYPSDHWAVTALVQLPGSDSDDDGVSDRHDNCSDPNPDQTDSDGDGVGDLCDACPLDPEDDADLDGFCADVDNCPLLSNPDQSDSDGDGLGDICANADDDGDGVPFVFDNCADAPNPDQEDSDGDSLGDACDACPLDAADDVDGDGVCGDADNCPLLGNPEQRDLDGDGFGDACDAERDGDGVADAEDNCLEDPNPGQDDTDNDYCGNVCDTDYDQSGYSDSADFATFEAQYGQDVELDADHTEPVTGPVGIVDYGVFSLRLNTVPGPSGTTPGTTACPVTLDGDSDRDGVMDEEDNCLVDYNPGQDDSDNDFCGNICDADYDQSGWVSIVDLGEFSLQQPLGDLRMDHTEPVEGPEVPEDYDRFQELYGGQPGPSGATPGTTACP